MFPVRGRHITIDINSSIQGSSSCKHDSIDTASELLNETLMEACKEAGWKARGTEI